MLGMRRHQVIVVIFKQKKLFLFRELRKSTLENGRGLLCYSLTGCNKNILTVTHSFEVLIRAIAVSTVLSFYLLYTCVC